MTGEQQITNKYGDHIQISKNLEANKQHRSSIYPIPHPKRPTLHHNLWRGVGGVFEALVLLSRFVFFAHLERGTVVVCYLLWSHNLIAMLCATSISLLEDMLRRLEESRIRLNVNGFGGSQRTYFLRHSKSICKMVSRNIWFVIFQPYKFEYI